MLLLGQVAVPGEQRAELTHLVPEHRVVPVVDVEIVVLDVGEDPPGEAQLLVEGVACRSGRRARCSSVILSRSAITASSGREMSSPAARRSTYEPIMAIGSDVSSIHERWW